MLLNPKTQRKRKHNTMLRPLNILILFSFIILHAFCFSGCGKAIEDASKAKRVLTNATPNSPNYNWARSEAQKHIDRFVTEYNGRYYIKTVNAGKAAEHQNSYFVDYSGRFERRISGVQVFESETAKFDIEERGLTDLDRDNGYEWGAAGYYYLKGRSRLYSLSAGWSCYYQGNGGSSLASAFLQFGFTRFRSGKTKVDAGDGSFGNPSWKYLTKPTVEEIQRIVDEPRRKEGCE